MPTYRFRCDLCKGGFDRWLSIHHHPDERPTQHNGCGGKVRLEIMRVATYGVGDRGAETRSADARERRLAKDLPAYARLRKEGHQPCHLQGSHELETTAQNDWEIRTDKLVSVPDDRREEVNEMLAEGSTTDWSPIEQVHAKHDGALT